MHDSCMVRSGNAFGNVKKYAGSQMGINNSEILEFILKIITINIFLNEEQFAIFLNII